MNQFNGCCQGHLFRGRTHSVAATMLLAATLIVGSGGMISRASSPNTAFPGFTVPCAYVCQDDEPTFSAEANEFFESKIRPLLAERCFKCHGPDEGDPSGGLSISSRPSLLKGGETGPAIVPGNPAESVLIQAINYADVFEMPPTSKLPDAEIALLTRWVEMGAPWPNGAAAQAPTKSAFDLAGRRASHWCWQPISKPPIPAIQSGWGRDPIDAFILEKLTEHKLQPAAPADRTTLIRRVYFDLIGLPPTREEVRQFLEDRSSDAYEKMVDRVLASPHFGENWARHWMDLIRYAETYGHEFDYPLPYAFEYRDYLIRAFNSDLPYDAFVREHVAGDLLPNPRENPEHGYNESILATGFWYLGEATHGPVDVRGDEAGRIDNQIDVFGKTFLGLTIACARCHDHMFDAISTEDYYAMSGFMQSSRRQLAMMDVDHKIANAVEHLREMDQTADRELETIRRQLAGSDVQRRADYLAAAIQYLLKTPPPETAKVRQFQGEDYANAKPTGGNVTVQNLQSAGELSWSGDRQLWWTGGKPGDRLTLDFQVDQSGQYELAADFTTAVDYAVATILLDGNPIREHFDFYTSGLKKTGPLGLFKGSLESGVHQLELVIEGANPDAKPAFMLGLDFFELRPDPTEANDRTRAQIEQIARGADLDQRTLATYVSALNDPEMDQPTHPLHWLRLLQAADAGSLSDRLAQVRRKLQQEADRAVASHQGSKLFADFEHGDLSGWFNTGWAFDPEPVHQWQVDTSRSPNSWVAVPGTIGSGRLGKPLYGVLRSPTFTLENKFIHYRLTGSDAQVRIIIDGFTLDTYNALLFNGATQSINSPDKFVWMTQGQDIGNYLGHKAHLEIIDHSGGFVCLDEIRMSDQGEMFDQPAPLNLTILDSESTKSVADLAFRLSQLMATELERTQPTADGARLLEWLIQWRLQDESNVAVDGRPTRSIDALTTWRDLHDHWLRENRIPPPELAQAIADGTGENEFIFIRGNHRTLGAEAPRAILTALRAGPAPDLSPTDGSGRLQLAEQLVRRDDPLVSRVMVNRLWHYLFGRGIVASTDNFGVLGEKPTHPELLDYLAAELMDHGWSIKSMIRRLVTTETYRMSSQENPLAAEIDPDNRWLHRMNVRRLTSESIRDAILTVSGRLDEQMYGPSVPIYLTPFMQGRGRPGQSGPLDGNGRRSIYIEIRRNFLSPMMLVFDTPVPFNSIGRRSVSNVPSQALMLMNNPFVLNQAELWAERLLGGEASDRNRIDDLYIDAFARLPQPAEYGLAETFIEQQTALLQASGEDLPTSQKLAWRDLCHVIMNAKEFYYLN